MIEKFIHDLPKIELHIHIEGSLEPELMFEIAQRNNVALRFNSVAEVRQAYQFTDLQSFLDIYYEGMSVLLNEQDFYDMTFAYLKKAHRQNVRHVEIFFDPQAHTERGVSFATVIQGIHRALQEAQQQLNLSSKLIMCFLRHLSADAAMETLQQALPFKEWIIGVGLDSSERGHPPEKFTEVFDKAREVGFLTVAHAGEEGPPNYIWQALQLLKVSRIDHGVRCLEDSQLVDHLKTTQMPLTVCPLSNVKLRVFKTINDDNLKQLLGSNLCVTINSDDPAYFGGYLSENFLAIQQAFNLNEQHIYQLAKNACQATFLSQPEKQNLVAELDDFMYHASCK